MGPVLDILGFPFSLSIDERHFVAVKVNKVDLATASNLSRQIEAQTASSPKPYGMDIETVIPVRLDQNSSREPDTKHNDQRKVRDPITNREASLCSNSSTILRLVLCFL